MQILYVVVSECSVASAMTSDTPERYERLTSVSSSVDIDQRDTVSFPLLSQDDIEFPQCLS